MKNSFKERLGGHLEGFFSRWNIPFPEALKLSKRMINRTRDCVSNLVGEKELLQLSKISMPSSRKADYYLRMVTYGTVCMDFNDYNGKIILKRISFDGYGCCTPKNQLTPFNEEDSALFKSILAAPELDLKELSRIIRKNIGANSESLWEDALKEYGLI